MARTTRTIYGAELQNCMFHGIPYQIRPNTTLNEKLAIRANDFPAAGQYPTQRYMVVGNGGHFFAAGADSIPYIDDNVHRVSDASLFRLVPLVLRLENDDLPQVERAKYALRRSEIHHGERHYAYYARRIDMTNVESKLRKITVDNGTETVVPFVPNNSNLNPVPPVTPPNQSIPALANGDYLDVSMLITVGFTPVEVQEYINACVIIFGSDKYAAISEVGLVTGIDKLVPVDGAGGTSFQFNEIIAAQIATHIVRYNHMASNTDGATFTYDAGANEALLTEADEGVLGVTTLP